MRIPTKKLLTPELVSRFFVSVSENNEKAPKPVRLGAFQLFLLDYQDSNLDKQNQNLLCYHYTIVQSLHAFLGKRCKDTFFL